MCLSEGGGILTKRSGSRDRLPWRGEGGGSEPIMGECESKRKLMDVYQKKYLRTRGQLQKKKCK